MTPKFQFPLDHKYPLYVYKTKEGADTGYQCFYCEELGIPVYRVTVEKQFGFHLDEQALICRECLLKQLEIAS